MVRKHLLSTIGLLGLCFPPGCAQDRTSSIQRAEEFVPNPLCTIGADWDPDVDDPSHAALKQLAPTGVLRVGVMYGNVAVALLDPKTGRFSGTGIDVACRMAAQLELPLEFHPYPSVPSFLTAFRAGAFEVGFAFDPTLAPKDVATAHPYLGIENTYLVHVDSPFLSVNDVDQPGVRIGVPQGASPDVYLTARLKFATLVRAVNNDAALLLIKNGAADVIGTGRASEVSFIKTSWPGQGRVLSDNIFVAGLAPFMHLNNPDGVCYLTNYVERAKNSGLLAQAIARSNSTIGRTVPAGLPGCDEHDGDNDNDPNDHQDDQSDQTDEN